MTVTREFTVWCDGLPGDLPQSCGTFAQSGGGETLVMLKAGLIRRGWLIKPQYARCPECLQAQRDQK